MPNYQYKIQEKVGKNYVDRIVDVKFSMKYVGNEKELPHEVLDKISYLDKDNNRIIGTKVISSPSLAGFNSNGTSKNTTVNRQ